MVFLLGALRGSIFNGPQGTQGGDLGLGQALDARDIEPLIGSITAQSAHMLATLKAPEPDRSVLPAAGEPAAVGTHFERPHRSLMGLLHQHALAARHLPPAQPAVTASTDQQLPTWDPGQRRDHPRMPHKGMHRLSAVYIPHEQLPAVSLPLTAATRGQPGAIGAPGNARNASMMPRQPLELCPIRCVPHIHVAIITPADQPCPIGAEGHATDPGRELIAGPALGARCRCHIPYLHTLQKGSVGQPLPVWTPGYPGENSV